MMFTSQRTLAIGLIGLAALAAPLGAGQDGPLQDDGARKPDKTIGLSLLTLDNPYFVQIGEAAVEAGAKLGYRVIVVSADLDRKKQLQQIADFVEMEFAGVILSLCDSETGEAIRAANAARLPVVTVDVRCRARDAKVVTHVGFDNRKGGKLAAEAIIAALDMKGGDVAILGYKRAPATVERVRGFREALDSYNKKRKAGAVRIVAELDGGAGAEQSYKATLDLIAAHPELRFIFAINDPSALGAYAALKEFDRTDAVRIVGFDGQPDGRQAVKEGKLLADILQNPSRMGSKSVEAIVSHLKAGMLPPQILIAPRIYRQTDATKDPTLMSKPPTGE